ncbi:MAG: ABC transporter permease [Brevinema sp.]
MKISHITFFSIVIGFICSIIISMSFLTLQGYNAPQGISVLIKSAFGSEISRSIWMYRSTALLLTGLSASLIFLSGSVNLGQQGTLLIGIITTLFLGQKMTFPPIIQVPLLFICASLAGFAWNSILLLFRFKFYMNEMIGSLMFNFIARYLMSFLAAGYFLKEGATSIQSHPLAPSSSVLNMVGFTMALVIVFACYYFLKKHQLGYEIEMKGQNPFFTRLSGCSNKKIVVVTTLISSACAAMAGGFLLMGGNQHYYVQGLEGNFGWDGVMMSMMAANNILLIPLYSLFFAMLQTGAVGMEVITKVPSEFTLIFQGITVFCIIAAQEISTRYLTRLADKERQKATSEDIQ